METTINNGGAAGAGGGLSILPGEFNSPHLHLDFHARASGIQGLKGNHMRLASSFNNGNQLRASAPLSDDQIMRVAPSIFATAAHESRSARYTYVPTSNVLRGLRAEGFMPYMVAQSRARDASKREFTRHMLRLRRQNGEAVVGAEVPEIILVNSHDGTSSYQMLAGLFRFVCSNGMVTPVGTADEIRVHHKGDIVGRVIEGAYEVVKEFDRVQDSANAMKLVTLNEGDRLQFARAALVAKYGETETGGQPITEAQVLLPRRGADVGNDLWRTFNVVQENLILGGISSRTTTGRRTSTRAVTGISQNVQLNRNLWTLADAMKQLKAAE